MSKNIAASVRQRLLNKAKADKRSFNEVLLYFAMERFLYRLSVSPYAKNYVLKGGLMLRIWEMSDVRPTMDIDMLGITQNDADNISGQIADIISIEYPDGITFEQSSIATEMITEDADYQGVRVSFLGYLGTARVNMQIDIGFGDEVYPGYEKQVMPVILDFDSPALLCYSKETAIAEKFEAMVKLGSINSRMKDFYDIWMLSRQFEFNPHDLSEAIRRTFINRSTEIPENIDAFSLEFAVEKQGQWTAFKKRIGQDFLPDSLIDIVKDISIFLSCDQR